MTLLADAPAPSGAPTRARTGPGRFARRLGGAPLGAHLFALALVLLALVPVVGTGTSFSADEGAAIVQARSLSRGDGWVVEHPMPEADPGNAYYPLELSTRGPDGTAPFAKHPLYALLLAGADRLAGVTGMVLLSVLGTVAAAGLAGLLAARIDTGLARPALWAVGLATPLLFDGYIVIAHTLGAAGAAGAVLAAATAFERRSRPWALAVAPWIAAAVLLRTEAAFLAVGLAAGAAVVGLRNDRVVAGLVAGGSLFTAFVARQAEAAWINRIVGGTASGTGQTTPIPTAGFLSDRWDAFSLTWLRPGYDASPVVELLLVLMLATVLLGAYAVRRRRPGATTILAVAAGSAVAAVVLAPANIAPGLLVACPVIVAGLVMAGRDTVASSTARLAAVTSVVFALAVLATQYSTGGSGEWGGRYFALALPVAVPVLVAAIRTRGSRPLVAGLVVCSLAMGVMAVGALRSTHRFGADLIAAIDRTAGPDRPVLVTTTARVPRLAWPTFDDQRWLLSTPGDLGALVDRLGTIGVDRFTYVARGQADVDFLPGNVVREASTTHRGWQILVLRPA